MQLIESIKDKRFQLARQCRTKQGQDGTGLFPVEESLIIDALVSVHNPIKTILVADIKWWEDQLSAGLRESHQSLTFQISQGLMRKLYPNGRLPAAMALCESRILSLQSLGKKQRIVVLEDIQDAGNLGTIMRTSEALGYEAIIIVTEDLTHLYNRNAVRSSMGSIFRLDICKSTPAELQDYLTEYSYHLLCTSPHADMPLDDFDPKGRSIALAFGNESHGLSEQLLHMANTSVSIEMKGDIESINVAVSAGIFLYALRNI